MNHSDVAPPRSDAELETEMQRDAEALAASQHEPRPLREINAEPAHDLMVLCPIPEHVDEFIQRTLRPLMGDMHAEKRTETNVWCSEWRQHPLVSLHVHAAYLGWPDPNDEPDLAARNAVFWRNSYFDPIVALTTGPRSAFRRCTDGHRTHTYDNAEGNP